MNKKVIAIRFKCSCCRGVYWFSTCYKKQTRLGTIVKYCKECNYDKQRKID